MQRHAKELQSKAKTHEVEHAGSGQFYVTSASSGKRYFVKERRVGFQCSCDWAKYHDTRMRPCSHVLAVEEWLEGTGERTLSFWTDEEDAARQHRKTRWVGVGLISTSRLTA